MKKIKLLSSYIKGVRLSILVLLFMMLTVLYMVIQLVGQICYIRAGYDMAASSTVSPELVYNFQSWGGFGRPGEDNSFADALQIAKDDPYVETYCIYYTAWVAYNGETTNLVLYDESITDLLPALVENGAVFTEPMSCVVAGDGFENVEPGSQILLQFNMGDGYEQEFSVSGKLSFPNLYLTFAESTTRDKTADSLISPATQLVLMEANEESLAFMEVHSRVRNTTNFLFSFVDGTPEDHRVQILKEIGNIGRVVSLAEILENTEDALVEKYSEELPIPLFLLLVSTTSFFSTMILIFKKKEQELAVNYLCGASRKECVTTVMTLFSIVALIPTLVGIGYVLCYPYIERPGYVAIPELIIDWRCIIVVLAYYVLTQAFAAFAVWLQMRSHTPLGLLRGTEL